MEVNAVGGELMKRDEIGVERREDKVSPIREWNSRLNYLVGIASRIYTVIYIFMFVVLFRIGANEKNKGIKKETTETIG